VHCTPRRPLRRARSRFACPPNTAHYGHIRSRDGCLEQVRLALLRLHSGTLSVDWIERIVAAPFGTTGYGQWVTWFSFTRSAGDVHFACSHEWRLSIALENSTDAAIVASAMTALRCHDTARASRTPYLLLLLAGHLTRGPTAPTHSTELEAHRRIAQTFKRLLMAACSLPARPFLRPTSELCTAPTSMGRGPRQLLPLHLRRLRAARH